jgi:uncharacterized protein YigE (DUF2233 family)
VASGPLGQTGMLPQSNCLLPANLSLLDRLQRGGPYSSAVLAADAVSRGLGRTLPQRVLRRRVLHCSFDLTKDELRIYWRDSNGRPYRTFAAVAADLKAKRMSLQFAMNGGMYQDAFCPGSLYREWS